VNFYFFTIHHLITCTLKIKFDTLTVTLLGLNMFGKNLKKLVPTHYDDYKVYFICHIHSKIWNGTTHANMIFAKYSLK
jgi:hypothetical protein